MKPLAEVIELMNVFIDSPDSVIYFLVFFLMI